MAVASSDALPIDCISLPYSPPGDVEAELVYVEEGTPEAFEERADEIAGRIVMAHSRSQPGYGRWIHRKEKFDRSVKAGAVAFVFVSEQPGRFLAGLCPILRA